MDWKPIRKFFLTIEKRLFSIPDRKINPKILFVEEIRKNIYADFTTVVLKPAQYLHRLIPEKINGELEFWLEEHQKELFPDGLPRELFAVDTVSRNKETHVYLVSRILLEKITSALGSKDFILYLSGENETLDSIANGLPEGNISGHLWKDSRSLNSFLSLIIRRWLLVFLTLYILLTGLYWGINGLFSLSYGDLRAEYASFLPQRNEYSRLRRKISELKNSFREWNSLRKERSLQAGEVALILNFLPDEIWIKDLIFQPSQYEINVYTASLKSIGSYSAALDSAFSRGMVRPVAIRKARKQTIYRGYGIRGDIYLAKILIRMRKSDK
jgi:hypothetical protein